MKRSLTVTIVLLCVLTLSACDNVPSSSASIGNSTSQSETLPVETDPAQSNLSASLSEDGTYSAFYLNDELLSLLDYDNAAVKRQREGDCYAEITGGGTAAVRYYEPYLGVYLIPPDSDISAAWCEGYTTEGVHSENPFIDELLVLEIALIDKIHSFVPVVDRQDSLQQLFITDEIITYEFLCECLQQTPKLSHTDDVYYLYPSIDISASSLDIGQPITGGDYSAVFIVDKVEITVRFINSNSEYLAYRATIKRA